MYPVCVCNECAKNNTSLAPSMMEQWSGWSLEPTYKTDGDR